jgi:hypothetical protein
MALAGRTSVSAYGITFLFFLHIKYYFASEHKGNDALAKKEK